MESIEVRTNRGFKLLMLGLGLISLGFLPLLMWWMSTRKYPRRIDTDGVTLRSGERLNWANLTGVHRTLVKVPGGGRYVAVIDLRFGKRLAKVALATLADRSRVLAFINHVLRRDLLAV